MGDLIDIVSKNGALLLNVGPRPDGTIPEPEQEILQNIGQWLKINGEAIYGTRPWQQFGEGPTKILEGHFTDTKRQPFTGEDIRFTTKGRLLYATCLAWPGETVLIKSLGAGGPLQANSIANISMLGSSDSLAWSQNETGLTIKTPPVKPCEHAFTFKIELKH